MLFMSQKKKSAKKVSTLVNYKTAFISIAIGEILASCFWVKYHPWHMHNLEQFA
jgi:hypothetical protein